MKLLLCLSYFILLTKITSAQSDSLDIKIGQMLMVGIQETMLDNNSPIIQDIQKGLVGGILLYERNLTPGNTIKNLTKLTNKLKNASTLPLLISIDQEGGQVNRLKEKYGFKAMVSAKSVGDKHNIEFASNVGETIASALFDCGINLNYAPVLDIHNPNCPVLGKRQRCYSNNADSVYKYAAITIKAHHQYKVNTVLKHFPGHGNSLTDSHLGLADVTKSWKQKELIPYQKLIEDSMVDAIMTAHIVNRNLDSSGLPATLSKKIVTNLLRNQLKYQGVVISDDMQMHAISSYYGFEESIKLCINAGVDILMFSNNISGSENYSPSNIHATIKKLVLDGKISEQRINQSFARIQHLKATY